jgi:hypothetical protein
LMGPGCVGAAGAEDHRSVFGWAGEKDSETSQLKVRSSQMFRHLKRFRSARNMASACHGF